MQLLPTSQKLGCGKSGVEWLGELFLHGPGSEGHRNAHIGLWTHSILQGCFRALWDAAPSPRHCGATGGQPVPPARPVAGKHYACSVCEKQALDLRRSVVFVVSGGRLLLDGVSWRQRARSGQWETLAFWRQEKVNVSCCGMPQRKEGPCYPCHPRSVAQSCKGVRSQDG